MSSVAADKTESVSLNLEFTWSFPKVNNGMLENLDKSMSKYHVQLYIAIIKEMVVALFG